MEFLLSLPVAILVIIAVFTVVSIAALEIQSGLAALGAVVGLVLALWFLANINVFLLAVLNPMVTLAVVAGYLALGSLWSVIRWYIHVTNEVDRYQNTVLPRITADFATWVKNNDMDKRWSEADRKAEFAKYAKGQFKLPNPAKSKDLILLWMIYWPMSAIWTLVNEPVVRFFKYVYSKLTNTYQRIVRSAFGRFEELN